MRITESQLRRIIRQEVQAVRRSRLTEARYTPAEEREIIIASLEMAGESVASYMDEPDLYELSSNGMYVYGPMGRIEADTGVLTPPPAPGYDAELAKEDMPYRGRDVGDIRDL